MRWAGMGAQARLCCACLRQRRRCAARRGGATQVPRCSARVACWVRGAYEEAWIAWQLCHGAGTNTHSNEAFVLDWRTEGRPGGRAGAPVSGGRGCVLRWSHGSGAAPRGVRRLALAVSSPLQIFPPPFGLQRRDGLRRACGLRRAHGPRRLPVRPLLPPLPWLPAPHHRLRRYAPGTSS